MRKVRQFSLPASLVLIIFVYVWVFVSSVTPHLPSSQEPLLFYSNQSRQDIKLLFCTAIKRACQKIYVNVYGITDPEVISLLSKKSLNGIKTHVTYDKKASINLSSKLPETLTAHPIPTSGLMHRKILILDDTTVFLGSANLTTTSLKYHDNLVLGFHSKDLSIYLQSMETKTKKKRKTKNSPPLKANTPFLFETNGITGELWLLPDKLHESEKRLIEVLHLAKGSIQIAMFTLTHPEITQALIQAHKRGIKVEILIDYYTSKGASKKMVERMAQEGLMIKVSRGQQLLHHKWALIDEELLVMGSANWTKAAFEKNEDFLLFLGPLSKKNARFMRSLFAKIKAESFLI